jgi:hypothetical protein
MDADNNQIYKVAKYLDKYTKDGAYLQKLNKYLHKVQYGGDAMDIAREIQRMVGQVISMHENTRDALIQKMKDLSSSKEDITLGDYDKIVTKIKSNLGQHIPINEKPLINVEQTPELETSYFDIVGYIVDPRTNRVEGTIDDAKYRFPTKENDTVSVHKTLLLQDEYVETLLGPLKLTDMVKTGNKYKVNKQGFVRIQLNNSVKTRKFVDTINKGGEIVVKLPNTKDLQPKDVNVRLFVKPMSQLNRENDSIKSAINNLAETINKEIRQKVEQ